MVDHWKVVLHVYDTIHAWCYRVLYTAITCKVTKSGAKCTKNENYQN